MDDDRGDVLCDDVHCTTPTHDRCGNESLKLTISVMISAREGVCSYFRNLGGEIRRLPSVRLLQRGSTIQISED